MDTKRTRHVPLIEVAPLSVVTLESGVDGCPFCLDNEARREVVADAIAEYKEITPRMQEFERVLLGLQQELRVIRAEMTRSVRLQKKALVSHARCGLCGILVGTGHVSPGLVREPNGARLVCSQCFTWLDESRTTVDSQREKDKIQDDMVRRTT